MERKEEEQTYYITLVGFQYTWSSITFLNLVYNKIWILTCIQINIRIWILTCIQIKHRTCVRLCSGRLIASNDKGR